MADEPYRSKWESARVWLQAVAIPVVLAVAGFWQFYLKEVWWPATAINLTTDVTVKQAGLSAASSSQSKNLEAIELVITARNPSTSTVYLLANYWMAWGITVTPQESHSNAWLEGVDDLINSRRAMIVDKHDVTDKGTLLAVGSAFTDSYLRANEKVSTTYVFYVPQGVYDLIEVVVNLPTASRESPAQYGTAAIGIEYKLKEDRSGFDSSIYRVTSTGAPQALALRPDGELFDNDIEYYGWQRAESRVQLSLWPSKPTTMEQTETSPP